MKSMDAISSPLSYPTTTTTSAANATASTNLNALVALVDILRTRNHISGMFHSQFPPTNTDTNKNLLDDLFASTGTNSSIDFCDNKAQMKILKHHYLHEFSGTDEEVLKDYQEDSIIHKVVDEQPSTYRGREGAVHAWHDLSSHVDLKRGSCKVDLTHISVCKNHAQVHWKAESTVEPVVLFGTDSFTFDDTNHIKLQTTVALSGYKLPGGPDET